MRCTGVVLAGGEARRFGGAPKGLEMTGGVRIVDRVVGALRAASDALLLVANAPDAARWLPGVRRVADVRPGEGALGGIHAALVHAPGAALVVAWDMPGVTTALLAALRAAGDAGGADAVVPAGPRGLEPLCAWYAPACRAAIERRLDAGDRRARAWLADVRIATLAADALAAIGDPERLLANVNTPSELAAFERGAAASDAAAPRA